LPFSRKLTPAALPALTTTSRVARTEVCAGAISVSSATGLPSAVIETQLVFSARISRVTVIGAFAGAAGAVFFASAGLATGAGVFAAGLLAAPVLDGVADAEGSAGAREDAGTGGPGRVGALVVAAGLAAREIVPADDVPAASVPACEVCPALSEAGESGGCVDPDTGAEAGAGAEDGCEEAGACDVAVGPA